MAFPAPESHLSRMNQQQPQLEVDSHPLLRPSPFTTHFPGLLGELTTPSWLEDLLALDAIDRVGPGGTFLTDPHTLMNFKKNWRPLNERTGPKKNKVNP